MAVIQAQIHTFGWPIGLVLHKGEYRPRPKTDGIVAEINIGDRGSYDYWALRRDGTFYLLKNIFEDMRKPEEIFFNTIAHYLRNGVSKYGKVVNRVQWCYMNKRHIAKLKAKGVITQNVTQNVTQSNGGFCVTRKNPKAPIGKTL